MTRSWMQVASGERRLNAAWVADVERAHRRSFRPRHGDRLRVWQWYWVDGQVDGQPDARQGDDRPRAARGTRRRFGRR